jgi:hypothetical protein
MVTALLVGFCLQELLPIANGRLWVVLEVMVVGMLVMLASIFASSEARDIGKLRLRRLLARN